MLAGSTTTPAAPGAGGRVATTDTPRVAPPQAVPGAARASTVKAVEAKRASLAAQSPASAAVATEAAQALEPVDPANLKTAFMDEIRKSKRFFYGTVVAQAQRIDVEADKVVFVFAPQHRALKSQFEQCRAWLESTASQLAGRRMTVVSAEGSAPSTATSHAAGAEAAPAAPDRQQALKQQAMADSGVQALLDVFAAEIKDVEKM